MDMMNPSIWMILVLAFARLFGFMYFFPLISGDQVPPMVRQSKVCHGSGIRSCSKPYCVFRRMRDPSYCLLTGR